MQKPTWKFWLFGIIVAVSLEVVSVLWAFSQGYTVIGTSEVGSEYWMGTLIWYAILAVSITYGSSWLSQKLSRRNL
jgi:hypothetical protein